MSANPVLVYPLAAAAPQSSMTHEQNCSCNGRLYSSSIEKISTLTTFVHSIAHAIIFPINLVFASVRSTSSTFRKLSQNVLPMIEEIKNIPNSFSKLDKLLSPTFAIINTVKVAGDLNYFINGKYKKHTWIGISAKTFLSAGNILESLTWFSRLGLLSVTLGSSRVLFQTINSTLALAYGFFAIDTISKLHAETDDTRKGYLMLKLAKNVGELTLSVMMVAGRMSAIGLGILGIACISLEILNLIYKKQYGQPIPRL